MEDGDEERELKPEKHAKKLNKFVICILIFWALMSAL